MDMQEAGFVYCSLLVYYHIIHQHFTGILEPIFGHRSIRIFCRYKEI